MAKTTKKRDKAYKPREARRDVLALIFEGDQPLPDHQRATILMSLHGSVRSMARGTGCAQDWHTIVNALNTSQMLCENAGNKEIGLEVVYAAQNAMINVAEACKNPNSPRHGKLGFGPGDLPALNEGIAFYETLLEGVTKRQYTRAIQEAVRRLEMGAVVKVQKEGTKRFALAA
ncbi:hypothetical protein [Cupriavidus numazuensis]|uniref:Uncharacterized protein n=1 Tax=Cupriavidus numazuensis TaxID=221992 RepID=A0ABM8TAV0_9BURK|nr:hypothetical protein [Cupriavidus numazuensis]CAG2132370.1 hypothetical protein LMG26411_00606 [Cupriavidus numazuensis]